MSDSVGGFTIYKAGRADISDITEKAVQFFSESDFNGNLTANPDRYRDMLYDFIDNPHVASFVARSGEDVVGYIHIYCQSDYTNELVGEMYQFYVDPNFRGKGVARALVSRAVEQYREWGCKRAYSEAAAGFDDGGKNLRLFINLWKKAGYTEKGIVMVKDF